MKLVKIPFAFLTILSLFSSVAIAGDFDWLRDLSIQAEADPSGFRASLGARFKIGDVEINAVLRNVEEPADAYMVLRLSEMSRQPTNYVVTQYRSHRDRGWGVLAKNLGIKPGSKEFHALKNGHDLREDGYMVEVKKNRYSKVKGGGNNKHR
jgi:hypothetical protein